MWKYKSKVLKGIWKDFEMTGFRKWHAPVHMVEENVDPQKLMWSIYEEIINDCLKEVAEKYKMIGQIYDLNQEEKKWKVNITFKIDVYPEVKVQNDNWKTVKGKKLDVKVTDKDMENALNSIKKQFAEYKDVKKSSDKTIVKVELNYLDKDGKDIDTSKMFIWKEDFDEFAILKKTFIGSKWKELNFETKIKYAEDLPIVLKYTKGKSETKPVTINAKIIEIKEQALPEFTVEKLEEWFWEKFAKVADFEEKIKNIVFEENKKKLLNETFEGILKKVTESVQISVPNSMVQEEVKVRLKDIKEKFGWEEKLKKYLEWMWPDKVKEMYSNIEKEAKVRIERFFVMTKYLELTWLTKKVDINKAYDVEEKVIDYVSKAKA